MLVFECLFLFLLCFAWFDLLLLAFPCFCSLVYFWVALLAFGWFRLPVVAFACCCLLLLAFAYIYSGAPRIPPGPLEVEVEGPWGSEGDVGRRYGTLGVTLEGPWALLGTLEMVLGTLGALGATSVALGGSLGGLG